MYFFFFFSSRRRHTRWNCDWSSDVCSSDLRWRDLFTGPDRFIAPAMQQAKKPFRTRFQLLLRLTLNAGKHPGNQPARLAQLDDGNDCAILVQGDEGPAQVVQWGHSGHSVSYLPATMVPSPSPPAPYHLAAGGSRIRTLGPPCD